LIALLTLGVFYWQNASTCHSLSGMNPPSNTAFHYNIVYHTNIPSTLRACFIYWPRQTQIRF